MKKLSLLFIAFLVGVSVCAEETPANYYDNIQGLSSAALKSALRAVIRPHTVIPYGSGVSSTWGVFYYSDRDSAGYCMDMYCDTWHQFGAPGSVVSGCNIEHSFAKSWWGGSKNDAYKDCHHLNPSNGTANSSRSNYPLGVPESDLKDQSVTGSLRVGKISRDEVHNGTPFYVFEPKDEYKGDFARAYFYMATCYGDELTWRTDNKDVGSYNAMREADDPDNWLEFLDWEIEVLITWHRQDPVSQKEINRSAAVADFQHNHNPFIDHPNLAEYIWGCKRGESVDLSTLDLPLAVEEVEIEQPKAEKIIIDGHIFIIRGEQMYTIMGVPVK